MPEDPTALLRVLTQPDLTRQEMDKRFYLPRLTFEAQCQRCGKAHHLDRSDVYLSYPTGQGSDVVYFECEECGEDNELPFSYEITVRITPGIVSQPGEDDA